MELPNTLYAKSGDVYVAYQVFGNGPIDLVLVPGWISNLDIGWDCHAFANWLRRMGQFARVVIFDKRGTGLSDRGDSAPGMDERMDDIRAVMDAAGIQRAAVLGWSEGGSLATLFAASHPDRCQALVLQNAFAKFTFLFPTEYDLNLFFEYVREKWGTGSSYAKFSPSREGDQAYRSWWARRERSGASPSTAIALMHLNSEIDISGILPSVQVPTLVVHRSEDCVVDLEGGRQLAKLIPNAKFFEIPGVDHTPWTGEYLDEIADKIEEFLTGFKPTAILDRVLATVLFTDIVGSTELVETHGDRRWRQLLNEHDEIVRRELKRFRGREIKSLGDGFLATFDGPARAAHCSLSIIQAMKPLGIEVRAGLHTGEIEIDEADVRGVAVHIAARISKHAAAGESLVSRTVKDLVAGAELKFVDRGKPSLKGIAEPIKLFAAFQ